MKKLCKTLMVLLAITIFAFFVSCDNDTKTEENNKADFIGEWIQDSLETEIVITTPGAFTINSIDEDFEGLTGTYKETANGAVISIEGFEDEFVLIFLEQDVFKIELPEQMGGEVFFIKHRNTDINFTGVWKNSDSSISAAINDSTNALIVTLGTGEDTISIQGTYEEEDNAFVMFLSDDEYGIEQEIGSGMVSISGKAYTFCMDADGDWSSTILMKTSE